MCCCRGAPHRKQTWYLASGGTVVTAFAVETFGRLGMEAGAILADAALAVRRRNVARGHPARRPLQKWRATLSALVAKAVAHSIRAAQPEAEI